MGAIEDVDVSRLAAALNGARRLRLGMPVMLLMLAVPSLFALDANVGVGLRLVAWTVLIVTAVVAVILAVCDPANIRGRPAIPRILNAYIVFALMVSVHYAVQAALIMVPLVKGGLSIDDPLDEAGVFALLGGMSTVIVLMLAAQLSRSLRTPLDDHDRAVLASAPIALPTLRMGLRKALTSVVAAALAFGFLIFMALLHRIPYAEVWAALQKITFAEVWDEFVTGWSRGETAVVGITLTFLVAVVILLEKLLEFVAPRYAPLSGMWRWAKDARSALAFDRRPPVLLLRSFSDDAVSDDERAKDEYFSKSVEGAIASAVAAYGPFIAIGAPGEPIPGGVAYRIYLKDDEWQPAVIGWIRDSRLIVACVGTTRWVRWELDNIQKLGQFGKTLLLVPPSDTRILAAARWTLLDGALSATPWSPALAAITDRTGVLVLVLKVDGGIGAVRSSGTTRDDYHAATLWALHRRLAQ